MAPTTHTETHPLVFGQEVSFGSIAGPTDFIDVFVDANMAKNAIVEWRVYATVGSLVSCVGTSPGGGSVASVLKWSGPQGPYSPLAANGSLYELRAYWAQPGPVPTMKASIVGYDEFDTVVDTDASASEQIPASFAEVEFANAVGYSQFADVAVTQQFTGNVNFTLYALAEAGGVEAAVASQPLQNPNDSTTRIFSNLKLPGATSYSLRANNISTTGVGPTIAASLACYSTAISAAPTPTDGFSSVIYRPGAPSSGPFVETWPEVQAILTASVGRCIVYVDNSIVSPAPVPTATRITECYGRAVFNLRTQTSFPVQRHYESKMELPSRIHINLLDQLSSWVRLYPLHRVLISISIYLRTSLSITELFYRTILLLLNRLSTFRQVNR